MGTADGAADLVMESEERREQGRAIMMIREDMEGIYDGSGGEEGLKCDGAAGAREMMHAAGLDDQWDALTADTQWREETDQDEYMLADGNNVASGGRLLS